MNLHVKTETLTFREDLPEVGGVLDLDVELGEVKVRGHEATDVVVTALVRHVVVSVWKEGETVFVRARQEESIARWANARAEITVYVPTGSTLTGRITTGTLSVAHIDGAVDVHVTTGNVALRNLGHSVAVEVVTGSISYDGALVDDAHRFQATTGSIHLTLKEQPNARLDLSTTTGRVQCNMPLREAQRQKHFVGDRVQGVLGTGAGEIRAHAVTGSVLIEQH